MRSNELLMNNDSPHNIIYGNNSIVLSHLQKYYCGRINMVYIDPPYNRGDSFNFYSDCVEHNKWLENMCNVLKNLKELLSDDGSIWISIDDSEMAYLKVLCDEIFENKNFASTIIWQKRNTRENRKIFSCNHEYILVYAKNIKLFKEKRNLLPSTEDVLRRYKNPDNDSRGLWQSVTLSVQAGHAVDSQFYTIVSPNGTAHIPPRGRCWIYNEERMKKEIEKNNVWFGTTGSATPRLKKFLKDAKIGIVPETLWLSDFAGTNKVAKNELQKLNIYDKDLFDTPKPEKLLYNIIRIATNPGDIVLDCFLGSGTTTAVAHKMGRNYIGIDISDRAIKYADARMKEVVKGEDGGISKDVNWKGGGDYLIIK